MSTTSSNSASGSLFKKKSGPLEFQEHDIQTPESPNDPSMLDLSKFERTETGLIREFKAFVMGISGGDCAGKKEMINFMFDKVETQTEDGEYWSWKMPQTGESVAILHQNYFVKDVQNKYMADGTDWYTFKKKALSLSLGNQISINIKKGKAFKKVKIAPAKVICIEGEHIFCQQSLVNDIINLRVFIDSDSDVRLSRRIYKDTVENGTNLDVSILNYLTQIKPSYERQIEPTKVNCDLVVPHIGNGYADHKMKDRLKADMGIKNITNLLLTQVRSAIKIYEDLERQENEKQKKKNGVSLSPTKKEQLKK